jgi:DNA processing protein
MSEFLPFTRAATYFFPMRNRIISGMSCGVLVVEAGEKSGTMITANCALEQGRTVYAVPGRITDRMSFGTNELIRKGMAEPVFSAEDLLFHLGINPECSKKSELRGRGSSELKLTGNQKILFDLIELGEKNFDEICELTQLPVEVLNLHLTELEFSGLIKQLPGRIYTLS